MSDEIAFVIEQPLDDPANPSHAYCSACDNVKPIEQFKRLATASQARVWGWDRQRNKEDRIFTGKICNDCDKAKPKRKHPMSLIEYDKKLRLSGRYEMEVPDPDHKGLTPKFITLRALMVRRRKKAGKDKQKAGGKKAIRSRCSADYANLTRQVQNEIYKAEAQIKQGKSVEQTSHAYLDAYLDHLRSLRSTIKTAKAKPEFPKPSPAHYINNDSKLAQETRALYEALPRAQKEVVARKYLA